VNDFDIAVRERWAGKADAFERSFSALCAHTAGALLEVVGPIDGRSVLDVGTGTGTVAALAVARGAVVVGVDPDAGMLHIARRKAVGAMLSQQSLPELRWHDGSFDAVVANFVVNHVGDPRAAMRELARVAKPGARVAVTVWPHPKSPALGLAEQMLAESGIATVAPERLPEHLDFPRDEDGLAGLLVGSGLQDVRVSRLSWKFRTTFEEYWAAQQSGITAAAHVIASQPSETIEQMRQTLLLLTEFFRDGDELALPAEALLASGRAPAPTALASALTSATGSSATGAAATAAVS
jgi:SAM-dependent methyltransferase